MADNVAIRGGNWNNTSNAGVFNLNLNNPRSNTNDNNGFRAALPVCQKATSHEDIVQRTG